MLISQSSHCALIIVIELALHYDTKGVSLEEIAAQHHLPIDNMKSVAEQLCAAGIIHCEQVGNQTKCLFLTRQPKDVFAYDIVQIFDSEVFMGKFLDSSTGKWHPESKATRLINYERKQYLHYLKSRLKKINIRRWCEMLEHNLNYIPS